MLVTHPIDSGAKYLSRKGKMKDFVLISTQRSGTHWVMDMLGQHPQIRSLSELLIWQNTIFPSGDEVVLPAWHLHLSAKQVIGQGGDLTSWLFEYLRGIKKRYGRMCSLGSIIMYDRLGVYPQLIDYLLAHDITIIHLIRRNYLNGIISEEVACKNRIWMVQEEGQRPKGKVSLDTERICSVIATRRATVEEYRSFLSSIGLPYHEIIYEELLQDNSRIKEAVKFLKLGTDSFSPASSSKKVINKPLSEVLENYQELKNVLQGTEFERLIETADCDNSSHDDCSCFD